MGWFEEALRGARDGAGWRLKRYLRLSTNSRKSPPRDDPLSLPILDSRMRAIKPNTALAIHIDTKGGTMPRRASDSPAISPT